MFGIFGRGSEVREWFGLGGRGVGCGFVDCIGGFVWFIDSSLGWVVFCFGVVGRVLYYVVGIFSLLFMLVVKFRKLLLDI